MSNIGAVEHLLCRFRDLHIMSLALLYHGQPCSPYLRITYKLIIMSPTSQRKVQKIIELFVQGGATFFSE